MASPRGHSVDDVLSDVVIRARVTFRGLACTRWGIAGGPAGRIGFHAILSGECWVRTPDSDGATRAVAGGLILHRPTTEYLLAHSPDLSEPESPVRLAPQSSNHSAGDVGLLCGYFDAGAANVALVNTLPTYVFWPSVAVCPPPIAALLKVIDICSHGANTSPAYVLERLLESLIIMVLRTVAIPREAVGVVRANRNPQLQRLLTAVHREPGRRWTVRSMASVAGLSRSAFAELFHREVGESPAHYLQNYRFTLASRLKRQGSGGILAFRASFPASTL